MNAEVRISVIFFVSLQVECGSELRWSCKISSTKTKDHSQRERWTRMNRRSGSQGPPLMDLSITQAWPSRAGSSIRQWVPERRDHLSPDPGKGRLLHQRLLQHE